MKEPDAPRDEAVAGRLHEVERMFADKLNVSVPSLDEDLIETGVLDSLLLVELVFLLESDFGIVVDIEDLEFENFRSIRSIAAFIAMNA